MKVFITGASGFIGTNLVAEFARQGVEVVNYDVRVPYCDEQRKYWLEGDILDAVKLEQAVSDARPDAVVHLAARTDVDENTSVEEGYPANTNGTQNLLKAITAVPSVKRVIITSSQYVCGPGYQPKHDEDYAPVAVYGQSKVETERLTRNAGLTCCWTIIRPTNIWGPWHMRYRSQFWRAVQKGFYMHPAGEPVIRNYGYVGNIVAYILRILDMPAEQVNRQTFYLSDPPEDIREWVNAFSLALKGRKAIEIPRPVLYVLGLAGDVISRLRGKQFYITTSRVRSMTTNYVAPVEQTYRLLGMPPVSLEQGVKESVMWLIEYNKTHED
ncbi:MAG: NAD(P)-dependent oxidoreductase [Verrucomicrobiales bacterium]|jgi:nucleoside-diphosphate-sugar epimerase|nr:NAD(P)-dependent oxidoreductase [Verrucomicrobiales bacterium]